MAGRPNSDTTVVPRPGPPPDVRLGRTRRSGIAPSIFALVERGVHRRPVVARGLRGRVVLRFHEGFVPVRMTFGERVIRVEDGDLRRPDLAVSGELPDIVLLTTTRMRMGLPDPTDPRGRAALARLALGRVRLSGDQRLARALLELLRIDVPRGAERLRGAIEDDDDAPPPGGWIDVLT